MRGAYIVFGAITAPRKDRKFLGGKLLCDLAADVVATDDRHGRHLLIRRSRWDRGLPIGRPGSSRCYASAALKAGTTAGTFKFFLRTIKISIGRECPTVPIHCWPAYAGAAVAVPKKRFTTILKLTNNIVPNKNLRG